VGDIRFSLVFMFFACNMVFYAVELVVADYSRSDPCIGTNVSVGLSAA